MLISVITAASRGVKEMQRLHEQFARQTFRDFEHLVIYDGPAPADVREYFASVTRRDARFAFEELPLPERKYGTAPRNRGIELARGEFLVFADDDDLYHPDYLKSFRDLSLDVESLGVVRMNNYGRIIPRHPLREFPRECHVGTPSCCFPAGRIKGNPALRWTCDDRCRHDYDFVANYVRTARPVIRVSPRVVVRAANERIMTEHGITGAARERYLSWEEPNFWLRTFSPQKSDRWLYRTLYRAGERLAGTQTRHALKRRISEGNDR